jgi:Mycothiol maleylpyruvate isomerase N-terminal domain
MDRSYVECCDASRARLRALVERLSDDQLAQPLADGWTPAAELAHLAFWDRRASAILDRWARDGVTPSGADVDVINDALLPQWRLIPPRTAAADALAAAVEIDAKVASLSPDLAQAAREGTVLRLDRSHHRLDHLDALERLFP